MGAVSVTALLLYRPETGPAARVMGKAPAFQLIDQEGEPFGHERVEGKIWVADFFFSSCAGPCPTMSKNMAWLQETFRSRDDVALVNFSVDPLGDTPEKLKKYAAKLGADPKRWHLLNGSAEDIMRISVGGFKIGSTENIVNHSQKFVLVDKKGSIRGYFEGTDTEEVKELAATIRYLLKNES